MKGSEFRDIRIRLGLTEDAFARELGYTGKGKNRITLIREFEGERKRIPLYIARLAWAIDQIIRDDGVITGEGPHINWPEWPGYSREELDNEA